MTYSLVATGNLTFSLEIKEIKLEINMTHCGDHLFNFIFPLELLHPVLWNRSRSRERVQFLINSNWKIQWIYIVKYYIWVS